MNHHASPVRSGLDFLRHVGFWVLVLVAIYVVYVLVDVTFWPDRDHLHELAPRLPFLVGQILPIAVFAATSGRSGLFGGFDGGGRSHLWIAVALLAGAAYAITALVDPLLSPFTGSDALFPPSLDQAAEAARDAARNSTGPEAEAYLREAGGYLMRLVVPFATAAIVFVALCRGRTWFLRQHRYPRTSVCQVCSRRGLRRLLLGFPADWRYFGQQPRPVRHRVVCPGPGDATGHAAPDNHGGRRVQLVDGPLTLGKRPGFDPELFRKGDPALFRRLVREACPRMLAMIRCYASDDDHADELLQESWVQIYRQRARFSGRGSFPGWALAVSRNVCRMSVRGGSGMVRVSLHDHAGIPDGALGPAARLARRRRAKALYEALAKLTDRERQAIGLRLLEGRRAAEVAELMGVKEVSVRSLVQRGLKKLRRMKSLKRTITETEGL